MSKPSRPVAKGAMIALAVVFVFPTTAPAYVEGEYLQKVNEEENQGSVEREKVREAEAVASAQRNQEEERAVTTAQERSAREEREAREHEERLGREAAEQRAAQEARASECVVPAVIGDSLSVAGKVLRHVHCTLGKVSRSRAYRGRLVVIGEGRRAGMRMPEGTAVAIKLGRPKSTSHSRHK